MFSSVLFLIFGFVYIVQQTDELISSLQIGRLPLPSKILYIFSSYVGLKGIGPSWSWSYGIWIYNYLCNQCLPPLKLWTRILLMASCTWYNFMWDKVCQWLEAGWLYFPGISSTDINEILLKVALSTITLTLEAWGIRSRCPAKFILQKSTYNNTDYCVF